MKQKPYVIALHGGFLSPESMRRDMGDPWWVNDYIAARDPVHVAHLVESRQHIAPVVLVGYSAGGSIIGEVSRLCSSIAGVVLYESPLLPDIDPGGDFPVLWIRNQYRALRYRDREFADTLARWRRNHPVTTMYGQGRHVRWRMGWPPVGHGWDRQLNLMIENWVFNLMTTKYTKDTK